MLVSKHIPAKPLVRLLIPRTRLVRPPPALVLAAMQIAISSRLHVLAHRLIAMLTVEVKLLAMQATRECMPTRRLTAGKQQIQVPMLARKHTVQVRLGAVELLTVAKHMVRVMHTPM
eukprot:TRINITY_DN7563_c0_g1_i1.p6 TRINITY_DN7563_c0_g1~~TRINITY_DN7563_c0_g1_i1.p6  ORF type:complete len:117 (+),score=0.56 TRINITY_DN7563_c0_g1_i1:481-831(+)